MTNRHSLGLLSVTAMLSIVFSSCEKTRLELEELYPIVFRTDILPMTKATENSFENSDEVGVLIVKSSGEIYADNNKFVYNNGTLQSADGLKWYSSNETCEIIASYPYDPSYNYNGQYQYNAAIDQSTYGAFIGSDLLVGRANNVNPGKNVINLTFEHSCTQFQVNVKNQSSETIQSVKFLNLEYHQSKSYGFNGCSGDGVKAADIIPYHTSSNGVDIYRAFVPSSQIVLFQVEITTSVGTHLYKSNQSFSLKSGALYFIEISLWDKDAAQNVSLTPQFKNWETINLSVSEEGGSNEGGGSDEDDDTRTFASFQEMYNAGYGHTYTPSTPMGNHYIGAHVTTQSDKDWLLNASNEPDLLPSTPGYYWKEYPVTLYPFGTPKPADINQHVIGDCSACAVFAEMAYVAPDFIKSIIKDNGNKTYTVNMFDPQGKPVDVCVSSKFLGSSSFGAVSGKNDVACWSTILEKAMMKWEHIYQVNPDVYGIGSEHVAPLFTGEGDSFAFYPGNLTPSQFKDAVELAFESKCLLIGGFNQGGVYVGKSQTVTAHAYSFMKDSDPQALFAMRNPWGFSPGDSGYTDGVLHIMDDGTVPPLIDIRIICPGVLAQYYESNLGPYNPPVFNNSVKYQCRLLKERIFLQPELFGR